MDDRHEEIEVPVGPLAELRVSAPVFSFGGGVVPDGRDTAKPIAYDEHGKPLYAPRGVVRSWPPQ